MKDMLGIELQIGDSVAFMWGRQMYVGRIMNLPKDHDPKHSDILVGFTAAGDYFCDMDLWAEDVVKVVGTAEVSSK